jgi:hypothetical protein
MTTTKTPVLTFEGAVDIIADCLAYWNHVPELTRAKGVASIRRLYKKGTGPRHFFDADTLRLFGSRFENAPAGMLIDNQSAAPEGILPYKITAWVHDLTERGGLQSLNIGRAATLEEAQEAATIVADAYRNPHVFRALQLRAAGSPGSMDDLIHIAKGLGF